MKLGNRTISLIDRITGRFDRLKNKGGSDSNRETFGMFHSFLDALRNTIQNMMQNLQDKVPKRPIKLSDTDIGSSLDSLEREVTDNKAISELNAALKKLDKATRQKLNNV